MANPDRPSGLRPEGRVREVQEYVAGTRVFPGDAVHMEDDGKVDPAAAAEAVMGVALSYADADGDAVTVCTDPDQRYLIQADGADIDAQTDIGLNYELLATAGNTTFNESRMELDSSTGNVTITLQLRLLALGRRIDNEFGAQTECVVKINRHQVASNTVGL